MEEFVGKLPAERRPHLCNLFDRCQADRAAPSSESCNVEGMASGGRGPACAPHSGHPLPVASPTPPPSWSALRQTAARHRSCSRSVAPLPTGSALPPVTCSTIASTCGRPKRLSVSWLRCERGPPRRRELRPKGQQREHPGRGHLLKEEGEHLQRGGIGPVQIFPGTVHCCLLCLFHEPRH